MVVVNKLNPFPKELRELWPVARRWGLVSPGRMAILLGISVGAALFEGFGIAMLLPVLEFIEKGGSREALVQSQGVMAKLLPVFDALHLPVTLLTLMLLVAFLLVVRQAFIFGRNVYSAVLAHRFSQRVRDIGFEGLLKADPGFLDRRETGKTVNTLTVESLRGGQVVVSVTNMVGTFTLFPVYLVVLVILSFPMTLLACGVMALAFLLNRGIVRRMRTMGGQVSAQNESLGQFYVERLKGIRTIILEHQEQREDRQHRRFSGALAGHYIRLSRVQGYIELIVEPLVVLSSLAIMYISVKAFNTNLMQIGLFVFILVRLMPIARSFFINRNNVAALTEAVLIVGRLLEDTQRASRIKGGGRSFSDVGTGIYFKDLYFTYRREDGPVLRDVNLHIWPRRMVALVGPSGAGKSTLADLIPRLIVPDSGQILVDETPLEEFDLGSLRRNVAFVSQDSYVFNDTVFENIRYGVPEATEEEVVQAAAQAHADEFIRRLADGYQTLAGENGSQLSSGQRQRLILARALLRKSKILILDEPTSSLDSASEAYISRSIADLRARGEVTLLVIAHRLSTVQSADMIVVVEGGRIVAVGTHQELERDSEWYRRIIKLQSFVKDD